MSEDHDNQEDETGIWARSTAPQSDYTMRQVGIGIIVLVVGAIVAFGIPLALT